MTREDALTLVDRHVRILHGGPDYVQHHDPEGVVVDVTDTQLFMKDRSISRTSRAGGTWHRSRRSICSTCRSIKCA